MMRTAAGLSLALLLSVSLIACSDQSNTSASNNDARETETVATQEGESSSSYEVQEESSSSYEAQREPSYSDSTEELPSYSDTTQKEPPYSDSTEELPSYSDTAQGDVEGSGAAETSTEAPSVIDQTDPQPPSDVIGGEGFDTQGWITVSGPLVRLEQTTIDTGMGWSRVVYGISFSRPMPFTYTDAFGNTAQADLDFIAVDVVEQYGDDADSSLGSVYLDKWDPYVGQEMVVSGRLFDTGNAHTVGPVMLVDTEINAWPE